MAKSILDIEVNDEKFQKFQEQFAKYQAALKAMPRQWTKVGEDMNGALDSAKTKVEKMGVSVGKIGATMGVVFGDAINKIDKMGVVMAKNSKEAARQFNEMSKNTGPLAKNITNATTQLLKWASLTSVFGGLLGAGGLFGIGRLAQGASDTRRQAQGYGVNSGELRAAQTNYGRYIDVEGTLSGITAAQYDLSKRHTFAGVGVNPEGKTSAELMIEMLPKMAQAFKAAGPAGAQIAEARGFTQFVDIPTLVRLSKLNPDELQEAARGYSRDKGDLANSDATLRKWQEFNAQLDRAGSQIKAVLIDGLSPLVGPLAQLSKSVATAVAAFLKSPQMGEWIESFGQGIKGVAEYMGSPEFRDNIRMFLEAVGNLARGAAKVAHFFGLYQTADEKRHSGTEEEQLARKWANVPKTVSMAQAKAIADQSDRPGMNNFGNLRTGPNGSFGAYATPEAGIAATDANLRAYGSKYGINTLGDVIRRWAPPSENNTAAYIKNASQWTGINPDAKIDLSDPAVRRQIEYAIFRQEGRMPKDQLERFRQGNEVGAGRGRVSPDVVININNNTGGSAIVTTNQLANAQ